MDLFNQLMCLISEQNINLFPDSTLNFVITC